MHLPPMVPEHGIQYEEDLSSHHGRMCEDGLTDGQTIPFPIFPDSSE